MPRPSARSAAAAQHEKRKKGILTPQETAEFYANPTYINATHNTINNSTSRLFTSGIALENHCNKSEENKEAPVQPKVDQKDRQMLLANRKRRRNNTDSLHPERAPGQPSKSTQHRNMLGLTRKAKKAVSAAKNTKPLTIHGCIWKVLPESPACRFYVITVLVETTIDLAIEGELLVRVHEADASGSGDTSNPNKMPVYLSIFVLAHLFQFVMAIDAVYAQNMLQFIFLTVFNALFLVYAIIQIGEIWEIVVTCDSSAIPINVLTTIIPIVISIAEHYIGLGWKIYNEFGCVGAMVYFVYK
ncbi:hypothetical protein GGU10DRAFT_337718, partial [Lentinula aff. detonsa]